MIETAFTKQLGVKYPIICAPMFLVSTTNLVVAAGAAGGLGAFPALNYRPINKYISALNDINQQSNQPYGVNIIVQKSNQERHKHLELALEHKAALIITSLGKPDEVIKIAHQGGAKVYCDVINLEHAKKVVDLGADGLVAVGQGAGGHAGFTSPFVLIPQLARNFSVPVVAAGGIVDGAGMAAAFALGASAAYMGTRFIASKECEVSAEYKQAILNSTVKDVINTEKVDGYPGNFIYTQALEEIGLEESLLETVFKKNRRFKRWLANLRATKSLFGPHESKVSYKTVFAAGQCVGLIDQLESVQEIMDRMVQEYHAVKAQLPGVD